jgi:hypothetical protein
MKNLWATIKPCLPVFISALLSAFFVYFPITDSDIFWHLAAGKEIIAHKHFLFSDPFAYTPVSPHWIDLHWLFQLLCYGIYCIGAEQALLALKLLCVGGIVMVLCRTHRQKRYALFCAFLAPLLLYQVRYLVDVRPVLVTMLFTALYVFLFEHARSTGKNRVMLWCVPLQIVWTNCQGLYPIGLFIIGAYWIESAASYLQNKTGRPVLHMAVMIASAAACLVNPYGVAGLLLPFRLFSRITPVATNIYSLNISENVPLFSLAGFEAAYRAVVLCTASVTIVLFIINRKKPRLSHIILFAGFFSLACAAVRNVTLYLVAMVPIMCYTAATMDWWKRFDALRPNLRQLFSLAAYACALLVLFVPACRHAAVAALYPRHCALSPFRFPEKITALIKADPVPGNMFNDIRYGGYLIWHLYPEKKVFIDTRLVIRSPEFFAEYLAISDHLELFVKVAEKFNITYAVLPSALFTRHINLIKWLYHSGSWRLEYADGTSVLFVRSDIVHGQRIDLSNDTTVRAIKDSITSMWRGSPALCRENLQYFSDFLGALGVISAEAKAN